jgi:hypothetical protein
VSGRSRAAPWFRAPGERYELAIAQHEWSKRNPDRVLFKGGTFRIRTELFNFTDLDLGPCCENCHRVQDDVRERIGAVVVQNVVRLRAKLCDRCASALEASNGA